MQPIIRSTVTHSSILHFQEMLLDVLEFENLTQREREVEPEHVNGTQMDPNIEIWEATPDTIWTKLPVFEECLGFPRRHHGFHRF